jgi:trehalose 6-phosphate phosphatase
VSGLPSTTDDGSCGAALRAALQAALSARTLFGFDFDGTLAPIQAHPDGVAMDARTARAFAALTQRLDVAVITGRGVADVRPRLAGAPRWVVGNHGAEGLPGQDAGTLAAAAHVCSAWRAQLAAGLIDAPAGIFVEDKTYTLCLHYRQADDHAAARALLTAALHALRPAARVLDGKCVFNLLPAGSADKFEALGALAAHAGCDTVFFIGDDVTDETVFRQAPPAWVTVKVGMEPTAARFRLRSQHEVADFLEGLLAAASIGG